MTIRKLIWLAICAALVATTGAFAAKPVQFTPLGVTCGPAFFPRQCVVDVSGDGQTILFQDQLWTPDGVVPIGGPPEGFQVVALSDDGSTVIGNIGRSNPPLGPREEAAIWLGGNDWKPLGGLPNTSPCGFSFTSAFGVSGDGSKVVGLAWIGQSCAGGAHGFEWTEETGMVDLGSIVSDRSSRVNAISADGNVLVGWSDTSFGNRLAAVWDSGAAPFWIEPDGSDIFLGEAQAVNSDGSIVVGGGYTDLNNPSSFFEGWVWSPGSRPVGLGAVKGLRGLTIDGQHIAVDLSEDGSVIVGQDTLFQLGEQWAWIWTENSGTVFLQNYVRDRSNNATRSIICDGNRQISGDPCQDGWDFWNVSAVTNDGKTIYGTGRNPNGIFEAFEIVLP